MTGFYLVKTDISGEVEWERAYKMPGDCYASPYQSHAVQQTGDRGFIVAGAADDVTGGLRDLFAMKTDSLGDTVWVRIYGKPDTLDEAYSVIQASDGNYVIAGRAWPIGGRASPGIYVLKVDPNGDVLWENNYGPGTAYAVTETPDGSYAIAGYNGDHDVILIKTDRWGFTLWSKTYGTPEFYEDASGMDLTSDSGFILAGNTGLWPHCDFYVVRTDSLGDTLWTKTYGSPDHEVANCVQQTSDGGYVVAGYTDQSGSNDFYVVKIEPDSLIPCCIPPIRGNVNYDSEDKVNVSDMTYLVNYLFKGGPPPPCPEEADVKGNGGVDVIDLTYLVDYLFKGGPPPAPCPW